MGEILERPQAPARRRLDIDVYYKMAEAGILTDPHYVEVIDGVIIDSPAIGSPHAAVTNRLSRIFARASRDEVAFVTVQSPLRLDAYNEPQPDVMLLRSRPDDYRANHPNAADVLLLVEVSETFLHTIEASTRALRKSWRSGGLDRRSRRRRGQGLSPAEGGRLRVARAVERRVACPHARPRRDDRCRGADGVSARWASGEAPVAESSVSTLTGHWDRDKPVARAVAIERRRPRRMALREGLERPSVTP